MCSKTPSASFRSSCLSASSPCWRVIGHFPTSSNAPRSGASHCAKRWPCGFAARRSLCGRITGHHYFGEGIALHLNGCLFGATHLQLPAAVYTWTAYNGVSARSRFFTAGPGGCGYSLSGRSLLPPDHGPDTLVVPGTHMPAKTAPPAFESWGRTQAPADVVPLYWTSDFPLPEPPPDAARSPCCRSAWAALTAIPACSMAEPCWPRAVSIALSPSTRTPACCAAKPASPWPRSSTSLYPGAGSCPSPRHKICHRWRRHRQRHPRQEPPCRRHLRLPRAALRTGPLQRAEV